MSNFDPLEMVRKYQELEKENEELVFLLKVAYADLTFAAPYFETYQGIRQTANLIMDKLTKLKDK